MALSQVTKGGSLLVIELDITTKLFHFLIPTNCSSPYTELLQGEICFSIFWWVNAILHCIHVLLYMMLDISTKHFDLTIPANHSKHADTLQLSKLMVKYLEAKRELCTVI